MFLTVEHLSSDGGALRKQIGKSTLRMLNWIVAQGFPDDITIRCFNCNSGRARNGGVCPHVSAREACAPLLDVN